MPLTSASLSAAQRLAAIANSPSKSGGPARPVATQFNIVARIKAVVHDAVTFVQAHPQDDDAPETFLTILDDAVKAYEAALKTDTQNEEVIQKVTDMRAAVRAASFSRRWTGNGKRARCAATSACCTRRWRRCWNSAERRTCASSKPVTRASGKKHTHETTRMTKVATLWWL